MDEAAEQRPKPGARPRPRPVRDEAGRAEQVQAASGHNADRPKSKAERLEAKLARARAAEAVRAQRAAQRTGAGAGGRQLSTGLLVGAISVVAVLLVLLVLTGLYALNRRAAVEHNADLNAARRAVVAKAKEAAKDFGTYDYRHLDADFSRVLAQLTPSFRTDYSRVTAQLKPTLISYKGTSTAAVRAVGISAVTTKYAHVLVLLDQTVKQASKGGGTTIDRNRLYLVLEKQKNGRWLVSQLRLV
jgi:hypothetical protein